MWLGEADHSNLQLHELVVKRAVIPEIVFFLMKQQSQEDSVMWVKSVDEKAVTQEIVFTITLQRLVETRDVPQPKPVDV